MSFKYQEYFLRPMMNYVVDRNADVRQVCLSVAAFQPRLSPYLFPVVKSVFRVKETLTHLMNGTYTVLDFHVS